MTAVTNPITSEVLYATSSLVNTPRRMNMMFMPLDEGEKLSACSVVGIDAEFVTLNQVHVSQYNAAFTVCLCAFLLNYCDNILLRVQKLKANQISIHRGTLTVSQNK